MIGNGIEMYDLIPDLVEENPNLFLLKDRKFWVGVLEGTYPSPPVPRHKTKCYTRTDVYLYFDRIVFSMNFKDDSGSFYKIFFELPEHEHKFIQMG